MDGQKPPVSDTFWARYGKRGYDLIVTVGLLVLLSPILLITAALIKLTSPGPVLFSQQRGGQNGVSFDLLKFRTMRSDRKPDPKELVPLNHAEITRLGYFLRRFKVDELPQLLNVLAGSMSLVGPRPTLPDQIAAYDDFRRQRLLVRPGITGLAQVNGNAASSWDERILYDVAYVRGCSLVMDLGILLRTILVLILGEDRTTRPFSATRYTGYVTPPPGYGQTPRDRESSPTESKPGES